MKKAGLWLSTLLAFVLCVCCLVACGSSSKEGTYKFSSLTIAGETYKAGQTYEGIELSKDFSTITLKSDGTAEISSMGMKQSGTWKTNEEDSKKIDITIMGETQTVECSGGTITMEQEGMKFVLKK